MFEIIKEPDFATIRLIEDCFIEDSENLKEKFQEILELNCDVGLDLQLINKMDISIVQLIHSFCRSLDSKGNSLKLTGKSSKHLSEIMLEGGFVRFVKCSKKKGKGCVFTEFWEE